MCIRDRGNWPSRFAEIELPCVVMLNWIHSWGTQVLGVSSEEIWPVDLSRDLILSGNLQTVVEPDGTTVYYGNRHSPTGGHITRDFTEGYGPECYISKHAPAGDYRVLAKYYGSTQVSAATGVTSCVLWVVTSMFDWENETVDFKTVRLDKNKEDLEVFRPSVLKTSLSAEVAWGRGSALGVEEATAWFNTVAEAGEIEVRAVLEAEAERDSLMSKADRVAVQSVSAEWPEFQRIGIDGFLGMVVGCGL
eukprot:TRINITY_DN54876_c0_g1_i2.p1 TRINITY_DN54876_c0_g1~~TRINITY_DN54876_c0_g1_i2.p1  ORF type:complete len:249 (-),score=62.97 TRINITY_DN54876_c0_g1_i2:372-1118(-)